MPIRPWFLNRPRFQSLLEQSEFDAVVASSFNNVYYTTGAMIETQRRIPMRLALAVWPCEGEPTLIVGDIEEGLAKRESHISDVRSYIEFRKSPIEALAEVLAEKGLVGKTIGIEFDHLVASYYGELQEMLPGTVFTPADRFFDTVRVIKTDAEVALLGEASRITENAILDAYGASSAGDSEREVGFRIIENLYSGGADSMRFLVLGAGPNSVFSHHIPGERKLAPGDTIRQDAGAFFSGYASDIARMAFVERPSQAQLDLYRKMSDIHQETLAAVRPGVRANELFFTCQRAFEKRGIPFTIPHVGHSSGVGGGHEEPLLQPRNETVIEPGMVLSIEPVYHDARWGGYHIEDLLLVTEEGYTLLSNATRTDTPAIIPAASGQSLNGR